MFIKRPVFKDLQIQVRKTLIELATGLLKENDKIWLVVASFFDNIFELSGPGYKWSSSMSTVMDCCACFGVIVR